MNVVDTETFRSALLAPVWWLANGRAWAQEIAEPPMARESIPEGASAGLVAVLAVGGLLVIMVVAVKMVDLKNKRESESAQLQAQISDALLRDRSLTRLQLIPTVRIPSWSGSPATIELKGHVPNGELKDTVLRIVREEAARVRPDFQIEDHLSIDPTMARVA
jgi:hypothetical protein